MKYDDLERLMDDYDRLETLIIRAENFPHGQQHNNCGLMKQHLQWLKEHITKKIKKENTPEDGNDTLKGIL